MPSVSQLARYQRTGATQAVPTLHSLGGTHCPRGLNRRHPLRDHVQRRRAEICDRTVHFLHAIRCQAAGVVGVGCTFTRTRMPLRDSVASARSVRG